MGGIESVTFWLGWCLFHVRFGGLGLVCCVLDCFVVFICVLFCLELVGFYLFSFTV